MYWSVIYRSFRNRNIFKIVYKVFRIVWFYPFIWQVLHCALMWEYLIFTSFFLYIFYIFLNTIHIICFVSWCSNKKNYKEPFGVLALTAWKPVVSLFFIVFFIFYIYLIIKLEFVALWTVVKVVSIIFTHKNLLFFIYFFVKFNLYFFKFSLLLVFFLLGYMCKKISFYI